MSYCFEYEETAEDGLRRIAREQIEKALDELADDDLDLDVTVHQVRKRCKKVRGLLRLVRPNVEDLYQEENASFRDTARRLADARDAAALIECFEGLLSYYEEEIEDDDFADIRGLLKRRKEEIASDSRAMGEAFTSVDEELRAALERIRKWTLPADGYDAFRDGLIKTCKRGVKAMGAAYDEPSKENFHEWRKRAKYHRYHCKLLRRAWEEMMMERRDEVKVLTDYLGDDHDIAVFRDYLEEAFTSEDRNLSCADLQRLMVRRQQELRGAAHGQGERVFAEAPDDLADRFATYWDSER